MFCSNIIIVKYDLKPILMYYGKPDHTYLSKRHVSHWMSVSLVLGGKSFRIKLFRLRPKFRVAVESKLEETYIHACSHDQSLNECLSLYSMVLPFDNISKEGLTLSKFSILDIVDISPRKCSLRITQSPLCTF